jgi:Holliday junction resolvase-like predicted endonuclease
MTNNQIVNDDLGKEPLVDYCKKLFIKAGYTVLTNRKFTYNSQKGEIDLLVYTDTEILFIECKSPLAPTSMFEIRASYEHIEKANKQLDNILNAFSDRRFAKQFLSQFGLKYLNQNYRTCILFGNRIFSGYRYSHHPIRYVYELNTLLTTGKITSNVGEWKIWKGEYYTHEDLIRFLDEDNSFITLGFRAMQKVQRYMHIKGKKVIFQTYALNQLSLFEEYDRELAIISRSQEMAERLQNLKDIAMKK